MRIKKTAVFVGALVLNSCTAARPAAQVSSELTPLDDGSPPPRLRPPLITRSCDRLTPEELHEASDYLSRVTRFRILHPEDATDAMQQRDISGDPGRVAGVVLFLPAERGMNRAYLERLLYCHAVQPPHLGEHPNDPLLAPGVVSVEIWEAPGGEYQIRIIGESRADAEHLVERARALKSPANSGSVEVEQINPAP